MLCSSKLLHEGDFYIYKKNQFFPRLCREGPSLQGVSSFCQVAHHRLGGQRDVCSLQPARAPLPVFGKSSAYICQLTAERGSSFFLDIFLPQFHWHLHSMYNLDLKWAGFLNTLLPTAF